MTFIPTVPFIYPKEIIKDVNKELCKNRNLSVWEKYKEFLIGGFMGWNSMQARRDKKYQCEKWYICNWKKGLKVTIAGIPFIRIKVYW